MVTNYTDQDAVSCSDYDKSTNEGIVARRPPCAAPHASPVAILVLFAQRNGQLRAAICSLLARTDLCLSCNS